MNPTIALTLGLLLLLRTAPGLAQSSFGDAHFAKYRFAAPTPLPVNAEIRLRDRPLEFPIAIERARVWPAQQLSTAERVRVREFHFAGNTAFSQVELAKVIAQFSNRDVTAEELEEARRKLTLHYVNHGYVNSGALLKEQNSAEGVLTFTIIEGTLAEIKITGNQRYRTNYLAAKIARGAGRPFSVNAVREALQVLRENPNVRRINAEVQPGVRLGEALLKVDVDENSPYQIALEFDNHRPASIGGERLRLVAASSNLTGRDDLLQWNAGLTQGGLHQFSSPLRDFALTYKSPPSRRNANLQFAYSKGDSAVIEEPFKSLDISSRSENVDVGVRQLLGKTTRRETAFSLMVEHRQSQTFLGGVPFSFSRGDFNGKAQTTALRFGGEFLNRAPREVFAARSLLSWGGDFSGSTHNALPPNGRFLTWLGQAQFVRVLDESGRQLVLRANGQWSNRPLLSVEQFAIGGANSVRGYRQNQLVRDKGIVASAELHLPIVFAKSGKEILVLVPFADFGHGKNLSVSSAPILTGSDTIGSAGLGLLYTPNRRVNAQLFWGHPFRKISSPGGDLQDKGIHFFLSWNLL